MSTRINPSALRDPNWLQWAATAPLLGIHLASGASWPVALVVGLCVAMTLRLGVELRSLRPFPLQIRIGFLALVAVALLPGLGWLLWLPFFGTSAQVLVGYCPMARFLRLMPWNRTGALSAEGVWNIVTAPPGDDGLIARPLRGL